MIYFNFQFTKYCHILIENLTSLAQNLSTLASKMLIVSSVTNATRAFMANFSVKMFTIYTTFSEANYLHNWQLWRGSSEYDHYLRGLFNWVGMNGRLITTSKHQTWCQKVTKKVSTTQNGISPNPKQQLADTAASQLNQSMTHRLLINRPKTTYVLSYDKIMYTVWTGQLPARMPSELCSNV